MTLYFLFSKTLSGLAWGKRVGPRQGEALQSLNIKHYPLCTGIARFRLMLKEVVDKSRHVGDGDVPVAIHIGIGPVDLRRIAA